jgi:hypothetical protein
MFIDSDGGLFCLGKSLIIAGLQLHHLHPDREESFGLNAGVQHLALGTLSRCALSLTKQ